MHLWNCWFVILELLVPWLEPIIDLASVSERVRQLAVTDGRMAGYKASGDARQLMELGQELGIRVKIVDLVTADATGRQVSSSKVTQES